MAVYGARQNRERVAYKCFLLFSFLAFFTHRLRSCFSLLFILSDHLLIVSFIF